MRCVRTEKQESKAKIGPTRGSGLHPVPQASPAAALIPVLLAALSTASAGGPDLSFDLKTWAQAVVDALLSRLINRIPLDGERCLFTGLNRAQIYQLMKSGPNGAPGIASFSLAEPGKASGARFFFIGSALEYLRYRAERQATTGPKATKRAKKTKTNGKHS